MSNTQASTQRVAIILTGPTDWDEWIKIIKTKAKAAKIWEFMNPDTAKTDLPTLEEPAFPKPTDVNAAKTTFATLSADEKEELQALRHEYKRQSKQYELQEAALGNLRIYIQESILRTYLTYTFDCEMPYDMLVALKQQIASTNCAWKIELQNQYQKLIKPLRSQSIDFYLQEWEKIYTQCKKLKLPDVDENRPLFDFLNAISTISPGFTDYWLNDIQKQQDKGEELPDLYKIVELFRNTRWLNDARENTSRGIFAATYQEKPLENENSNAKTKKKHQCLCGLEHPFRDCCYIVECIREKDWKPDPAIQTQVDKKLKDPSPKLKSAVEAARKEAAERKEKEKDQQQENSDTQEAAPAEMRHIGTFWLISWLIFLILLLNLQLCSAIKAGRVC